MIAAVLTALVTGFISLLLEALIAFLCWNLVVVPLFGVSALSVWQVLGLLVLIGILKERLSISNSVKLAETAAPKRSGP